jgi:hypothetical protein
MYPAIACFVAIFIISSLAAIATTAEIIHRRIAQKMNKRAAAQTPDSSGNPA